MAYTKTTHALTVLADSQISTQVEISKLKRSINEQFAIISKSEREAAMRAIFVGIQLHFAKATLKHGQWGGWLEKNIEQKKSQVNNYMRLALVAIEKTKASKSELIPMDRDGTIQVAGTKGEKFVAKIEAFIGELNLTELLIKHGIKGVGMHTELTAAADDEEQTPAQKLSAAREQVWQEAYNNSQLLRQIFAEPDKAQLLSDPKQIQLLLNDLEETKRLARERLDALLAAKI